jgi:hypothetical protein
MTKFSAFTANRSPIAMSLGLLTLVAMTVAPMPKGALADGDVSILKGAFTVAAAATPNTGGVTFCGGRPLELVGEGHGAGYSTLGGFSVLLQKTLDPGPQGAMHGCLVLTAPDGDTLSAIYDGIEGAPNANNFIAAAGTLAFTGGSGRFEGATGNAKFTAIFDTVYPESSFVGGTSAPLHVMAFYSVDGTVHLPEEQ